MDGDVIEISHLIRHLDFWYPNIASFRWPEPEHTFVSKFVFQYLNDDGAGNFPSFTSSRLGRLNHHLLNIKIIYRAWQFHGNVRAHLEGWNRLVPCFREWLHAYPNDLADILNVLDLLWLELEDLLPLCKQGQQNCSNSVQPKYRGHGRRRRLEQPELTIYCSSCSCNENWWTVRHTPSTFNFFFEQIISRSSDSASGVVRRALISSSNLAATKSILILLEKTFFANGSQISHFSSHLGKRFLMNFFSTS